LPRPAALEQRLGHRFTRPDLLEQALTRGGPAKGNNERMEFLGDAVLDCVMAEELYQRFPRLQEGGLHSLRVSMIRESTLAEVAYDLGIREFVLVPGSAATNSGLADTLEAIFGAVFLDGGYPAAQRCILKVLGPYMRRLNPDRPEKDAKTKLQELLIATFKCSPTYRVVNSTGAAHQKTFEVECRVAKLDLVTTASGSSRQRGEQAAAAAMLKKLKKA
jgi:ribonuclease-3